MKLDNLKNIIIIPYDKEKLEKSKQQIDAINDFFRDIKIEFIENGNLQNCKQEF